MPSHFHIAPPLATLPCPSLQHRPSQVQRSPLRPVLSSPALPCPTNPASPSPCLPLPPCSTDFDGYSGDETVRVVMSGNQEPRSVEITQEAYEQVGGQGLHPMRVCECKVERSGRVVMVMVVAGGDHAGGVQASGWGLVGLAVGFGQGGTGLPAGFCRLSPTPIAFLFPSICAGRGQAERAGGRGDEGCAQQECRG